MKHSWLRAMGKLILQVACSMLVCLAVYIATKGMFLVGVPGTDEVWKVTITYPTLTDQVQEYTDEENIELAVKLTGFLKYSLFAETTETELDGITIYYHLDNGKMVSVTADEDAVMWQGKAHALKDPEIFMNLATTLFFEEEP